MSSDYRFGRMEVNCEGYDYPEDRYVLVGSCGVSLCVSFLLTGLKLSSSTINITTIILHMICTARVHAGADGGGTKAPRAVVLVGPVERRISWQQELYLRGSRAPRSPRYSCRLARYLLLLPHCAAVRSERRGGLCSASRASAAGLSSRVLGSAGAPLSVVRLQFPAAAAVLSPRICYGLWFAGCWRLRLLDWCNNRRIARFIIVALLSCFLVIASRVCIHL